MPRYASDHIPAYRLHRQSGNAIVTLNIKDYPLGKFGSPESKIKYHDLIAKWLANGRRPLSPVTTLPDNPAADISPRLFTIGTLLDAYIRHADAYYRRPDGKPTGEVEKIKRYTTPLRDLFGDTLASGFGPTKLELVRDAMIKKHWARNSINGGVHLIRRVFRWGVAQELIRPEVLAGLAALDPLRRGRSKAVETDPIKPVDLADVDAIKPYVSSVVWGMCQFQLLTGARSGEIVGMRATDIDRSKPVWVLKLEHHKTSYRGHSRTLYIGPKAQAVLLPFITSSRPLNAPIFSPRESLAIAKATKAKSGRRPNQKPNPRKTGRMIGDAFTVTTYRRSIARACALAEIEGWHPHQLRHTYATTIRSQFGADLALTMLGDKSTRMVDVYAERDFEAAMKVAAAVG